MFLTTNLTSECLFCILASQTREGAGGRGQGPVRRPGESNDGLLRAVGSAFESPSYRPAVLRATTQEIQGDSRLSVALTGP